MFLGFICFIRNIPAALYCTEVCFNQTHGSTDSSCRTWTPALIKGNSAASSNLNTSSASGGTHTHTHHMTFDPLSVQGCYNHLNASWFSRQLTFRNRQNLNRLLSSVELWKLIFCFTRKYNVFLLAKILSISFISSILLVI